MVQWLQVYTVLAKDWGLAPRTRIAWLTMVSSSRDPAPSSGLHTHLHAHMHTQTCTYMHS